MGVRAWIICFNVSSIPIIEQVLENYSPYWHFVSERGSWKWKPVIRSPAHSPTLLQLPILAVAFNDTSRYIGDKNWIQPVLLWLSSSFSINYTCYQYIAVGKFCTLCVQMLYGANWHEAPWKPGLFTFWLWSGHCIQLAFASKSVIQIYIIWDRLMAFKNKSYLNVISWIILQLGLQNSLLKSPTGERE